MRGSSRELFFERDFVLVAPPRMYYFTFPRWQLGIVDQETE